MPYQQHSQALTGFFNGTFGGPQRSSALALATIYNQLNQQAQMQGYQDVYMELSWMSLFMVFMAFLLSANRPGQAPGGAAMH